MGAVRNILYDDVSGRWNRYPAQNIHVMVVWAHTIRDQVFAVPGATFRKQRALILSAGQVIGSCRMLPTFGHEAWIVPAAPMTHRTCSCRSVATAAASRDYSPS